MTAERFRKKPVEVEAMLVTTRNGAAIEAWCEVAESYDVAMAPGQTHHVDIGTLEGTMRAEVGDWIIKGVAGEFYPCKPDIFEVTYGRAEQVDHETALAQHRIDSSVGGDGVMDGGLWEDRALIAEANARELFWQATAALVFIKRDTELGEEAAQALNALLDRLTPAYSNHEGEGER